MYSDMRKMQTGTEYMQLDYDIHDWSLVGRMRAFRSFMYRIISH